MKKILLITGLLVSLNAVSQEDSSLGGGSFGNGNTSKKLKVILSGN